MQLELTFGNDPQHLPSVRAFLATTLEQLPLAASAVAKLETLVQTAVEDAVASAYPPGDSGLVKLSINEQHGKLEIRVRDFGIPKDISLLQQQSPQPAADVVDEIHWLTFGPDGKALQLVKWLHETHISAAASTLELQPFSDDAPAAPQQQYDVRRMRAAEAEQVSQLMYRTYGNTYFNEDVYYPERIAAQNEHGAVFSYVAVGEDGIVAGHYALERNQSGPVVEGGQAVVDPAHRGRGLLNRLKDVSLEEARQMFDEMVETEKAYLPEFLYV